MEGIHLTGEEVEALVLSIMDGIEAAEEDEPPRDTWVPEMRLWCDLLLGRSLGDGA